MTVYINGTTGYSGPVGVLGDLTTTGNTILGDQSTDTLNVANGNLVLNSSGNLGVGTASPTQKLHVSNAGGVIALVQNTASSVDTRFRAQNLTSYFELGHDSIGGYLQESGAYPISFYTNSAERARIDASGNFMVGTTTAYSTVTIGGNDSNATLSAGGGNTNFTIRAMGSQGALIFGAGGVSNGVAGIERMRLDSSGNLGIGTTPAAKSKLHVEGGSYDIDQYIAHLQSYTPNIVFQDVSTSATDFQIQADGSVLMFRYGNAATNTQLASEAMRIDDSGNLTVTGYVRPAGVYSVNGGAVVAADSAMPATTNSLGYTLAYGPGGNDGHILGLTWSSAGSYGAQIWVDTDPTYFMATRGRSSVGAWNSWVNILNTGVYRQYLATPGGARTTTGVLVSVSITVNNASNRIFITGGDLMRCSSGILRAELRRDGTSIENEFMYQQANGNLWQTTTGMYTGTNFPTGTYTMDLYANFGAGAGGFDGPSYFQVTVWDGI